TRAAVSARPMVDRDLRNAIALLVREHWDETMQLAVEHEASYDLGAIRLEAAVHVVEVQARHAPGDPVEELRRKPSRDRVASACLPARHEIESLLELREQARDLGRVVLQVAVDRDHDVPGCLGEAGGERGRLAEVPAEPDDADVVSMRVEPGQGCERS